MTMDDSAQLLAPTEEVAARSGVYRLLARLWLREVDSALLDELNSAPLSHAFADAGGVVSTSDDATTIDELAIEYCRLFVGPTDHLPPFQSVWQSGQFQDGTAASMKEFVEIVDYDADALPSGIMLDHLGVQLDVMGHILGVLSTRQAELQTIETLSDLAQTYWLTHVQWPADLLELAGQRVTSGFYRFVISMTRDFLDSESRDS